MKYIIVSTNRKDSRSLELAKVVQKNFAEAGEQFDILNLSDIGLDEINSDSYATGAPAKLKTYVDQINQSEALYFVVPEYNGSLPGALKYFIDFWKYPDSFEFRPVAFVGLGGMFGGLRAVEHLQQILGYRNAFQYPERLFLQNIWNILKNGALADEKLADLLKKQCSGFTQFYKALAAAKLAAHQRQK